MAEQVTDAELAQLLEEVTPEEVAEFKRMGTLRQDQWLTDVMADVGECFLDTTRPCGTRSAQGHKRRAYGQKEIRGIAEICGVALKHRKSGRMRYKTIDELCKEILAVVRSQ